ncbi:Outward-rectifier potassium channel TOK1 [Fulvia fulva]|uniref:Outward-rectifier potassium channel TOK1 n=1 Tax=Passalora fulva TaxID=5499 RepID=A0A9Q8PM62_PASFU|nr:Outward-rectifier potassium channel TOK1 [Fulvia fulva]UJO25095.1 Outward-rectifier potassium channel TOK1 [Fulvia fulva]WPV22454.1 Outward-rectifier potassium channel TOK1 [Fulvia fulva]
MSTVDPGIGESVSRAAEDMEPDHRKDGFAQETDDDYVQPNEWWFASALCPLLGATFGPVANGFSICALVYPWRAYIPPGKEAADGIKMEDPRWLIAVNAVSLAFALIGNGALLLNMARRVKFSIAQPTTITGYFAAGILLIADTSALASAPNYYITDSRALPAANHALTSAYYYAIMAASIYMIIGALMCLTVYGALAGRYKKEFNLGPAQRTLMLQTMSFIGYELLGALVFSKVEGWKYLDAVYWSQVTLLTIGLGDFSPQSNVGRGLLFPFAIGGILMVGLVVGSIRSLVLERGQEKMAARITEKRRETAVNNVDERKQTIKISWLAQADFSTDPSLTPAQRREEEFSIMRKVQATAERERRYFALCMSLSFALMLWFVGAAVFMVCEREQGWTYFTSLYFAFTGLLTIGYGDETPASNAGKAFFVIWSLLAVPSLTILISNMGDTIVKWFTDITEAVAQLTVLPGEEGFRISLKNVMSQLSMTAPGILGETKRKGMYLTRTGASAPWRGLFTADSRLDGHKHREQIMTRLATRLEQHIEEEELQDALQADSTGDPRERDIHFYHYVLSRELRSVQKDLNDSPPKKYTWGEWEYYLRLVGNVEDNTTDEFPGQNFPDTLVPQQLRAPQHAFEPSSSKGLHAGSDSDGMDADKDGVVDRVTDRKERLYWDPKPKETKKARILKTHDTAASLGAWSWLSDESPLMSSKTESQWILERLSAALVRELNRARKGYKKKPPISMDHITKARRLNEEAGKAHEKGEYGREHGIRRQAGDPEARYAMGEK